MLYRVKLNFDKKPEVFEFEASDDEAACRYLDFVLGFCPVCRAQVQSRTDCIVFDFF